MEDGSLQSASRMQNAVTTLEIIWQVLTKLNVHLPRDPTISLLSNCQKEKKKKTTYIQSKSGIQMLIADLLIITENQKPDCGASIQHHMTQQ